ncbi:MAG: L,D-transpeptidase [Nitrospira sp.]|nr:L,D-transpeptidase [Nitrospira sp.]
MTVLTLSCLLTGCVKAVPEEVVQAVASIDHDLVRLRASEIAPREYARFAQQWIILKARVEAEDDTIRWPWEPNDLESALRGLHEEGVQTVRRLTEQRESLRRTAEQQLVRAEDRSRTLARQVGTIDSRLVLGRNPVETDLLLKQARSFYQLQEYGHSLAASEQAAQRLATQASLLNNELGRYASRERIARWQKMVKETVEWSRSHRTAAIVVSKADRRLILYRNGQHVLSYSVRLGFNGIREKRYQGDGATPEGRYHVTTKRGQGQTQFFRALVLDYPNAEDRQRFLLDRKTGHIPNSRGIGGQIEIHGTERQLMAPSLGCVMLENPQMAWLFSRVEKGTPVTIVGALDEQNSVALVLADLRNDANEI